MQHFWGIKQTTTVDYSTADRMNMDRGGRKKEGCGNEREGGMNERFAGFPFTGTDRRAAFNSQLLHPDTGTTTDL